MVSENTHYFDFQLPALTNPNSIRSLWVKKFPGASKLGGEKKKERERERKRERE